MASTYKVLGQVNPSATTNTDLYTVPSLTSTVCSTLSICNQSATNGTFRVAIRPAGAAIAAKHYIAYDTVIPANDTVSITAGITLATTDVVTVYSSSSTMSFNLYGSEVT